MEPEFDEFGFKFYIIDGVIHREDGPAVIHTSGYQAWYWYSLPHRTDGPAIIYDDGTKKWYLNGQHHRTDGPAIINSNGSIQFWAFGIKYDSLEDLTIGVVMNQ